MFVLQSRALSPNPPEMGVCQVGLGLPGAKKGQESLKMYVSCMSIQKFNTTFRALVTVFL